MWIKGRCIADNRAIRLTSSPASMAEKMMTPETLSCVRAQVTEEGIK